MKAGVRWTHSDREKTAVSKYSHRLPVIKQPVKPSESDGVRSGAGDGTRTRDSLLGRQELYQLSYSRVTS